MSEEGGITTSGENINKIEAVNSSSNSSSLHLDRPKPIFQLSLAPQLSKHYSNTLNANDSIPIQIA